MNQHMYPVTAANGKTATSYEAAIQVDVKTWEKRVLDRLAVAPFTMDEIADYYQVQVTTIRPRGSSLKARGEIVETGERRRNKFGRNSNVMKLVPQQSKLF